MTWTRLKSALTLGGKHPLQTLKLTWKKVIEREVMTRAAGIAFYAMLALVPFLALMITLGAQALPESALAVGGEGKASGFQSTLRGLFPAEASEIITSQIKRIREAPPVGLLSIGLLVTMWTASSLFVAIIDAMNVMYGVKETRSFLKLRITAIVMTLIQAAILIGALVAIVVGPELISRFHLDFGLGYGTALAIQWVVVFLMILLSFALTNHVAPDVEQRWEWISPGSLYGTILLIGFTSLFRIYVQNFASYQKTYGSLGGVMVMLLWLWVSSLVLLAAAQLNQVVEEASPLGKSSGQKYDPTRPPDLAALKPEPMAD